jgi:endonuclease/exonuclease/phosphatase family metal-dependent hydrolase
MNRSLLLAAFILFLVAIPGRADQAHSRELRVMTFNIRYGLAEDGENSWPHRKQLVVEAIRRNKPDILGLQEALPLQIDFLQTAFPEFAFVGRSRESDQSGEQCAILFRRARFRVRAADTFWAAKRLIRWARRVGMRRCLGSQPGSS